MPFLQDKVEEAARKAAAFSAAGVFATVGIFFLTLAAWLILVELRSEIFAACVLAAIYLGIAAILLARGLSRKPAPPPTAPSSSSTDGLSPLQLVVASFLQGLEQGRKAGR